MPKPGRRRPSRADVVACAGKTRWASEAAARRALTAKRADLPGVFDSGVRPYRCGATGKPHWHWGHSI